MIFLTVGTQDPFDRLVKAVDHWAIARGRGAEVFGQITDRAGYRPVSFESASFLDPDSYQVRCAEADLIVAHAGMGTIITSMRLGKRVVIMPRREHLREQRNDHQWGTAQRFRDRPGFYPAMSEGELPDVLDSLAETATSAILPQLPRFAEPQLIAAIRTGIYGHEDWS